jgi:hypothetical protein
VEKRGEIMEKKEEKEMNLFSCPSCGTDVNEDAKKCPGCDAQFEEDVQKPPEPTMKNDEIARPSEYKPIVYPPPPDLKEGGGEDPEPPIEKNEQEKMQTEKNDIELKNSEGGNGEFDEKMINKEDDQEEDATSSDIENDEDIPIENEGEGQDGIPESDIPSEEELEMSDGLHELKKLDEKIDLHKQGLKRDDQPENKILNALNLILFVLLWLVVVYDVLVYETEAWFGAHIILILVAAGIFFTLGLYMILTYPKSSLMDILTYMTEVKQKRKSMEY